MPYTAQQVYNALIGAGATPSQATTLTGIAGAESTFGANTVSPINRNGSQDFGVFQINNSAWPQYGGAAVNNLPLQDQAAAALHIYNTQGPGAWSTYNSGAYTRFLNGINPNAAAGIDNTDNWTDPVTGQPIDFSGADESSLPMNVNGAFDNLPDDTFNDTSDAASPVTNTGQYTSWLNQQLGTAAPSGQGGIGSDAVSGGPLLSSAAAPGITNATPVSPGSGNPIQPTAAAGSGASASSAPQGTAQSSGGGTPINITDATNVGSAAANTISKAEGGLTSGIANDTQSVETTGTGWLNSIFGDVNNTLIRSGFVFAGLVVLLLAGLFFYLDAQKGGGAATAA